MSILTISNVAKYYGTRLLFQDVAFSIAAGDKVGLVGRNGSGKTTLLRIILGQELPDSGRVSLASGRRLGYLRQEAPVHPEHTIAEEIEEVFAPQRKMAERMTELEHAMSAAQGEEELGTAMSAYAAVQDAYEAAGGYRDQSDVTLVLEKLGFSEADLAKRIGSCSGGEQTRLALAKIVLSRPDLLILDEPTNHLDIDATEWLESFLRAYEGAILLVSHDRYFLDSVAGTIADLDNQKVAVYKGNYSHYARQKQEQLARQQALFEQQQAEIARLEDMIKRNQGADAIQAKMRHRTQSRIDRIERVERPAEEGANMRTRLDAEAAGRIGREVLRGEHVVKAFGERTIFGGLNFVMERGDRLGVVGPNGAGKTTLIKMILGQEQPDRGVLMLGHNARVSYFSQHAADSLAADLSVLDSLLESADFTLTEARNYLARFLFTGDDVFKQVAMLSGGEKNKLALARMIVEPSNLLILDEPTNHLDIASCEVLTDMLSKYNGTMMLVSHDRYLLNAVTTKTLAVAGNGAATYFEGGYGLWREQRPRVPEPPSAPRIAVKAKSAPPSPDEPIAKPLNARELSKARVKAREAVEATEKSVHRLETRIAEIERLLAKPSASADAMVSLAAEHTRLQDDLLAAFGDWEKALGAAEELGVG